MRNVLSMNFIVIAMRDWRRAVTGGKTPFTGLGVVCYAE
jgi:hypothetical protein